MTVVSDKTRRRIEELQKGEKRNKRVLGKGMVVAKLQKGLKDKVSQVKDKKLSKASRHCIHCNVHIRVVVPTFPSARTEGICHVKANLFTQETAIKKVDFDLRIRYVIRKPMGDRKKAR